jgi:hypothetical protein
MPSTVHAVRRDCPRINHNREYAAFRDWHIAQGTAAKTQAQWDALFRGWCSRKQSEWEKDHPTTDEGVRFDDVTGMPVNPRPQVQHVETEREAQK